jgi:hypothetical protein
VGNGQFTGIGADGPAHFQWAICLHAREPAQRGAGGKDLGGSVRLANCALGPARQWSGNGREGHPGVLLVKADGGKLQVRGCSFGTDEPSIALRPGLKHAIVTENNGMHGVAILNEIGGQAVVANDESERKGP